MNPQRFYMEWAIVSDKYKHLKKGFLLILISDGFGSNIFVPGQVESIFSGLGRVGSAIYGLGLDLENFP